MYSKYLNTAQISNFNAPLLKAKQTFHMYLNNAVKTNARSSKNDN